MNVIKMEVNTEKVFFICEINSNVSYYRNENYASLFHVVVNDIKSHKNYYCLGHTFCFPAYSSQKVQNQNHERSSTLINHSALETMKLLQHGNKIGFIFAGVFQAGIRNPFCVS